MVVGGSVVVVRVPGISGTGTGMNYWLLVLGDEKSEVTSQFRRQSEDPLLFHNRKRQKTSTRPPLKQTSSHQRTQRYVSFL